MDTETTMLMANWQEASPCRTSEVCINLLMKEFHQKVVSEVYFNLNIRQVPFRERHITMS